MIIEAISPYCWNIYHVDEQYAGEHIKWGQRPTPIRSDSLLSGMAEMAAVPASGSNPYSTHDEVPIRKPLANGPEAVVDEMPKVCRIGYETRIGKQSWNGNVYATGHAIYCFLSINRNRKIMSHVGGAAGGVVGGLIARGISSLLDGGYPVGTISAAEMPADFFSGKPGPPQRLRAAKHVFVIKREDTAAIIKSSLVNNTLELNYANQNIVIAYNFFRPRFVRDFMASTGWPLRWRSQKFNLPQ